VNVTVRMAKLGVTEPLVYAIVPGEAGGLELWLNSDQAEGWHHHYGEGMGRE
jgi:hypothetical protein